MSDSVRESLFSFIRNLRRIDCPICAAPIRERDLRGDGCPHCGTYVEEYVEEADDV